jgi:uncharacterized membrane protein
MASIFASRTVIKVLAVILILLGWGIKYWLNRRRFYRRNATGIETFKSYENMRLTNILENLGWLIGNILITVGILAFILMLVLPTVHHK